MKQSELEALVLEQGRQLQAAQEAHMHLVQRADNIVEGFKMELAARDERIQTLSASVDHYAQLCTLHETQIEERTTRIEMLEKLVLARNASAPTKRNMTDEDALKVLTGDLKDLSHKDAAEKAGLTYAQVYSCRLEFTFKHVHKDLRDNLADWKNPWSK
jgi:hypothetical protein